MEEFNNFNNDENNNSSPLNENSSGSPASVPEEPKENSAPVGAPEENHNEPPRYEPPRYEPPRYEPPKYNQPYENTPFSGVGGEPRKPQNKIGGGLKVLAVLMTVIAVLALCAVGVMIADRFSNGSNEPDREAVDSNSSQVDSKDNTKEKKEIKVKKGSEDSEELSLQDAIKAAKPSVVAVASTLQNGMGYGSGFIYTEDGYIITNAHVVSNATEVKIITNDGTEYKAEVVGGDTLSDVAVLKVDADNLKALTIGDSDALTEGDEVVAIGSPASLEFFGTCTHGIISAVNREVSITDSYSQKVVKTMKVIQTDAAINSGNSGGPLINLKGEVIGVNSMKLANGYEGMGFALPINGVCSVADILIQNGSVDERPADEFVQGTPALGVTVITVSEDESTQFGWPKGCYVYSVVVGGAADNAGIQRGDIIVAFEGKAITSNEELVSAITDKSVGDKVKVTVNRGGENIEIESTLKASE